MDPSDNRGTYDPDQWDDSPDDVDNDPTEGTFSSHKKLFLTIIISIVLLILAVMIAVLLTWPGFRQEPPPAADTSTRVFREDYGEIAENIGDPAALIQNEGEDPVIYQPSTIIDACNVLSLQILQKHGLLVKAGTEPGTMNRHYFDGSSVAIEEQWETDPTLPEELNDCTYPLVKRDGKRAGNLYLSVHQPAYASGEALRAALDDYLVRGQQMEGVDVYDRTTNLIEDTRTFYYLEKNDVYASLEIDLGADTAPNAKTDLLESVVKRFSKMIDEPVGPAEYGYESPTFSGTYVSACPTTDARDISALFQTPASPSLQERIATATGVTDFGGEESNVVANQCIRRTTGPRNTAETLDVTTHSFERELAASEFMESKRVPASVDTADADIVGDAMFYNPYTSQNPDTLYFRVGTTVFTVAAGWQQPGGIEQNERLALLRKIAANMLERMNTDDEEVEANNPEEQAENTPQNQQQAEPASQ